jgi:hypothetical protein
MRSLQMAISAKSLSRVKKAWPARGGRSPQPIRCICVTNHSPKVYALMFVKGNCDTWLICRREEGKMGPVSWRKERVSVNLQ